ncbi:MAG: DUF488 domain-containing protein [Gemmatimonadota bacterium]
MKRPVLYTIGHLTRPIEEFLELLAAHSRYRHLGALGGLRRTHADSPNSGWINASFRGYADYMQTEGFQDGLRSLEAGAREHVTTIMCAEGFPARCHRSLIADGLAVDGWRVLHIQSRNSAKLHRRTGFLNVINGQLLHPKPARAEARK